MATVTVHWQQILSVPNAPHGNATVNVPYDGYLPLTVGGVAPYSYAIQSGSLGALSLNSSTGAITGTPTAVATLTAVVRVTDSANPANTFDINVSIDVVGSLSIASQSFMFGALTKAGAGGIFPVHTGTISGAEITAGDSSGHWQITSGGYLTPTAAGDTANLNGGPYALTITGDGFEITWTIATTGNHSGNGYPLASMYSVSTEAELKALLPINVTLSLVQDKYISLRSGQFGDPNSQALLDIDRVKPTAANPLTITCDDPRTLTVGETSVTVDTGTIAILPRTRVIRCEGIIFEGIGFHHNVWEGLAFGNNPALLNISANNNGIIVNNYLAYGDESLAPEDAHLNFIGIGSTTSGGPPNAQNITITNGEIRNVKWGIYQIMDSTGGPLTVQGNHIYNTAEDFMVFVNARNFFIDYNLVHDPLHSNHTDFCQFISGGSGDVGPGRISGNRGWSGAKHVQGPFLDDEAQPWIGKYLDVEIVGNCFALGGQNGITCHWDSDGLLVKNNTVVRDSRMTAPGQVQIFALGSETTPTATRVGAVIENNVSENIAGSRFGTPSTDGQTLTNNVLVLGPEGADYDAAFDGTGANGFEINSLSDLMTKLAPKTGGSLDLATLVGAVGYVDWTNRTIPHYNP